MSSIAVPSSLLMDWKEDDLELFEVVIPGVGGGVSESSVRIIAALQCNVRVRPRRGQT